MLSIEWAEALKWYLTVQLWSLPAIFLGSVLFQALPDRGYALAKFFGVLLVSLFAWIGFAWLGVPFTPWVLWLFWLLLLFGSVTVYIRDRRFRFLHGSTLSPQPRIVDCVLVEILFFGIFATWIWVVAHDPGIEHTEQPMDFMFLVSLWNTVQYPPPDPWYSGFGISYYYFGYWMMAALAKAAQVLPQVAYNLSTAGWYGFLWLGAYSLAFNIVSLLGRAKEFKVFRRWYAWAAGLLSAASVAFMGTLSGALEFLYAFNILSDDYAGKFGIVNFPAMAGRTRDFFITNQHWWWWRSTRVIHDKTHDGNTLEVISEFPVFSYLLGDNHPHVLASPILLLGAAYLLQVFAQGQIWPSFDTSDHWIGDIWVRIRWFLTRSSIFWLGFLLLSSSILANTWDAASLTLLVACGLAISVFWTFRSVKFLLLATACFGILLLILSTFFLLPHHLLFHSPVRGLQINALNPTEWQQLLVFWGPLLLICPLLAALAISKGLFSPRYFLWTFLSVIGISVLLVSWSAGILPGFGIPVPIDPVPGEWEAVIWERWSRGILLHLSLALIFSLCLASFWSWWEKKQETYQQLSPYAFLVFCAGLGLGYIYLVEFLFVYDGFGPLMRMNSVFKFYYQAWPLLGTVLGTTVVLVLVQKGKQPLFVGPVVGILLLMTGCLYYPLATVGGQIVFPRGPLTLDIREHLAYNDPSLAKTLDWIDANVGPSDVILEAPGHSYNPNHSRISSLSGRPTLLGWDRHEKDWRGDSFLEGSAVRNNVASTVYASGNPQQVAEALAHWNIRYVYVGPHERSQYGFGKQRQAFLANVLTPVFEVGSIQILKLVN